MDAHNWHVIRTKFHENQSDPSKVTEGGAERQTYGYDIISVTFLSFLSLGLYSPLDLGHFFQFLNLYTVGRTPLTGDQPVVRPLPTHTTTQTQNKRAQTSML
jgi:hypothetical protein